MIFGERYLISWITVMEKRSTVDNTMILFDRVTKTYETGQKALDDVSIQIEKGEFVFLVGNSGAGKTTLLELILRETEADQGNIVVNGIDLRQLKERQVCRYRRYIGMVFQDFCLFPDFTVYENVAFAQRVIEADHKRMRNRVMEVLSQVGLEKKAGCYPGQLSGGEKQRTALARAVVNQPVLLLADEPTGNLDQKNAEEIMRLLEKINRQGTTVLVVSHNQELVKYMHKRQIALRYGKVIKDNRRGGLMYGF